MVIDSPEYEKLPIEQKLLLLQTEHARASDGAIMANEYRIRRRQEERAAKLQQQMDSLLAGGQP